MVLGGRVETVRGGRREIVGVAAEYFKNLGNSLLFNVISPILPRWVSLYEFSFGLFMMNYVPVVPLPSASIESDFKLESMHLVNEGSGLAIVPEYTVILGQRDDLRIFYVFYEIYAETSTRDVLLNNSYYITQSPAPAPTSLLL
jgi:hypothetical protein